jgi:UDP-N-acetylglucosamine 2-epimerase (non-hydrolysing)
MTSIPVKEWEGLNLFEKVLNSDTPLKVVTVLGTRPEIIRLSRIIPKLDKLCNHILVHTGQSYDYNLSQVFFDELGVRQPDYFLGVKSETFGEQIGHILMESEKVFLQEKPDKLLILGDTNSALSAIVAKRMSIPVYHMEAGNRCFDDRVPEEVNRRIIDHSSDIHMPYTERSRANLLGEGVANNKLFVIGNPIYEVLQSYKGKSGILTTLGVKPGQYFLATAHRQENVDIIDRLQSLLIACSKLTRQHPVIFSLYPRTAKMMEKHGLNFPEITFHDPFNFADFLELQHNAACVITDSGTVQEECCILNIRCVTIRDTTERPETVECGSNILSGVRERSIFRCVNTTLGLDVGWTPPAEYLVPNVSDKVVNILMGVGI